jgi:hypothetical protein
MRVRPVAALLGALVMLLAPAANASEHTATVTLVHGIPYGPSGFDVDVYVDGDLLVEGFQPKTVTDPVELPAGTHDVEIFETGADPATDSPAIADSVDVEAGANVSVVAHLAVDASPTLSVFANDTSTLEPGQARVTFRHVAAEQAVDIIADDARLFGGLTNGGEGVSQVPAGEIDVAVVPAGGTEVLLPLEATIDLGEGVNTIVYVVGQLGDGEDSLDFIVQTIAGLHGAPSGVESGLGGLKAGEQQHAARVPWMIAMAAIVLVGAGVAVRRVRSG